MAIPGRSRALCGATSQRALALGRRNFRGTRPGMTRGEIRPAQAADIEPVCKLLHEQMSAKFSLDRWRRLMTYRWLDEKPDFGRVAFVDGRLVGFVGMVYANRVLDGRPHRVVNICAWYLKKAHRKAGFGFELMRSAIADDTMSYTILTTSSRSATAFSTTTANSGPRKARRPASEWSATCRASCPGSIPSRAACFKTM